MKVLTRIQQRMVKGGDAIGQYIKKILTPDHDQCHSGDRTNYVKKILDYFRH
ncbi:MAG: hypothetical protein AAFV95_28525 [Bacteroidota bacterium]